MRLTSTGLGIGTSSPAAKLEVTGNSFLNGNILTNSGSTIYNATGDLYIRSGTSGALRLGSNGTNDKMTLDSSGNLGLGVTPSAWLGTADVIQVGSASFVGGYIAANAWNVVGSNVYYDTSANTKYISTDYASEYRQYQGQHRWYTAPSGTAGNAISFTQAMTLDASGNLGVGTTSPTSGWRLDVQAARALSRIQSTTGTQDVIYQMSNTGGNLSLGIDNSTGSNQTGAAYGTYLWSTVNSPMVFATNNTERARITSSGGFKQQSGGASYEDTTLGYSEFNNGEVGTTALLQRCTNASFNGSVSVLKTSRAASTGFVFISAEANSVIQFSVRGDGNVYNTNNSYGAISDAKLKENVTDATPKLDKLNQVRVVNFNMIGSEQKQLGVIAQELEQVFPGMVDESPDRDAEGNDLGTTTKSVKYSVFVPMLIKALQEATTEINSLKARLDAANL
jgi:hypothetical protein